MTVLTATSRPPTSRPVTSRRGIGAESAIVGMAIFLMAETMLFAGLVSTAMVLRMTALQGWTPDALPKLPVWLSAANMGVLLASGWMLRCGRLNQAIALGTTFVVVQGIEWSRLLLHGIQSSTSVYGGVFYTLVGVHAMHVLGGLSCLIWAVRSQSPVGLRACSMYWYFVVIVWPALYAMVYL